MKIYEAIEQIKNTKPSQYTEEQMMDWLSKMDGQVWADLLKRYGVPVPLLPYKDGMKARELLIPFPYDGIYLTYLATQIDYYNAEFERYNNGMMLYNAQLQAFYNAYTREHAAEPVYMKGVKAL